MVIIVQVLGRYMILRYLDPEGKVHDDCNIRDGFAQASTLFAPARKGRNASQAALFSMSTQNTKTHIPCHLHRIICKCE